MQTPSEPGTTTPRPDALTEPYLLFGAGKGIMLDVQLCNPGTWPLLDVVVASAGITMKLAQTITIGEGEDKREVEVPLQTATARKPFERIEAGAYGEVGQYDPMSDGEFITIYEVTYTDPDGARQRRRAVIGNGGPRSTRVKLKLLPS